MTDSIENVLSRAIKSRDLQFSKDLVSRNPDLLRIQDRDGFRPLDVASAYGFLEIVQELLNLVPDSADICWLPGRDGKSAIHHASINGKVDVIKELTERCPNCVAARTSSAETALHFAVKYYKFEALQELLQRAENLGMMKEIVNAKDREGNTILHHSVYRKQIETVEILLGMNSRCRDEVEVGAQNSNGKTAMDLLETYWESPSETLLKQLLQDAGGTALVAPAARIQASGVKSGPAADTKPKNFVQRLNHPEYNRGGESAHNLRNALLVVAVLFVTVAFQGGINLPSHIFPEHGNKTRTTQVVYLALNTGVLTGSTYVIHYLMHGMPFQRELIVAEWALMGTYGCSVGATDLHTLIKLLILVIPTLTWVLRWALYFRASKKQVQIPTSQRDQPEHS